MTYRTHKFYHNDETILYVYQYDWEISKIVNEITKIPRAVKKGFGIQIKSYFVIQKVS